MVVSYNLHCCDEMQNKSVLSSCMPIFDRLTRYLICDDDKIWCASGAWGWRREKCRRQILLISVELLWKYGGFLIFFLCSRDIKWISPWHFSLLHPHAPEAHHILSASHFRYCIRLSNIGMQLFRTLLFCISSPQCRL